MLRGCSAASVLCIISTVEIDGALKGVFFLFFIGVARAYIGSLGDDQRGPMVCARGVTEPILPLQDIFLGNSRADLFLTMRPLAMESWRYHCIASDENPQHVEN